MLRVSTRDTREMESILGPEIGRGGFGVVYIKKDDDTQCVKVSHKTFSCRRWSNEYAKIINFMAPIERTPAYKSLRMVRVVKPTEFVETPEGACYMVLPRVFRPEGKHVMHPTLQAQLGWPKGRMVHKGRGEFIGYKEIQDIVSSRTDMETACYELGVIMGLLHHVGRHDAYDVELYLGKEAHSRKPRFYLADFDLSEPVTSKDDADTFERILWSLDAVPYFPRPHIDQKLFELFKKGYESVCTDKEFTARLFDSYS